MNRRVLLLLCIFIVLLCIFGTIPLYISKFVTMPTNIYINGKNLKLSHSGSIIERNGQLLAPVKELASQTGWKLEFINNTTKPDCIKLENELLDLKVEAFTGISKILINGEERHLSVPPEVVNGVLLFPVKDFFYAMNCSAEWDENNKIMYINQPYAKVFAGKDAVAKKVLSAPVIDGMDNDEAWKRAIQLGGFSTMFYNEKPAVDTNFKVTYDDVALYLFVSCEGKPVPLEGISVLLAPEGSIGPETPYYQFTLVPEPQNNLGRKGGINVSYGTPYQVILKDRKDIFPKYSVNENSWTAEVKIPLPRLSPADKSKPTPVISEGDEWRINVSRIRPFTEGISSWVPLKYSYYQDLPTGDISYDVEIPFAPVSNRTGSIFFEKYPVANIFDSAEKSCAPATPENAAMLYQGYTKKLVSLDIRNIDIKNTRFYIEWVNELGKKYKAEILKITETGSKIHFLIEHPKMINEGLYRLNIYVSDNKKTDIKKYELMFDKQDVMDAGVIYNSFALDTKTSPKTLVENVPISPAAQKLISIIPKIVGFRFTGNPDRPEDKADGLFSYDYENAPDLITARLTGNSGTKTTADKGTGTTPSLYANNKSLTAVTRTGKETVYNYYEDKNGKQYFLDAHIDFLSKEELRRQIVPLAKTDPLGAAYVLFETAKAYQDWLPSADYYWRNYPIQLNWGPPFHFFGGMWSRWYVAELASMKEIVEAYGIVKNTKAFDIVSKNVGSEVEKFLVEGMFKPAVAFTKTYPTLNHNMEPNKWIGLIALSKGTGNPDYIHEAIDLIDYYASSQFMLDGFWKEVSMSYHRQSLNGLDSAIEALNGWSDPAGYISPRTGQNLQNLDMDSRYSAIKAANLMHGKLIYPNGKFFPIQDTWANEATTAADAARNLAAMFLPAANIARMSKGSGAATNQLYLTYTSKYGHNQKDPLSLALYSNGQELLPDLGYTHTKYRQWASSTMSHNTVVVDSRDSAIAGDAKYGGKLNIFADIDEYVQIMKASQENAYPGLKEYDREPWYIKMEGIDSSYIVDIFRVDGGNRHEYTINGDANSENVTLTSSIEMSGYNTHLLPTGTTVIQPAGELDTGSAERNYYGYLYIEDVKKADLADGKYEITMNTADGTADKAGMRITGFAGEKSELFIGKAPSLRPLRTGPQGTYNDKNELVSGWFMPKMVVRRDGYFLKSTFVNVMEPFAANNSPKITSIEKLNTQSSADVALMISYGNVTDIILSSSAPNVPLTVGDITLTGRMALVRYIDGKTSKVYTVEADNIIVNGVRIDGGGKFEGKIVSTMRKATGDSMNAFIVSGKVEASAIDKTITVTHPDGSVHAFEIATVTPDGANTIIEIKDMDPGFEIFKDGSSELRFYPLTKWKGDHTFKIAVETVSWIE